MAPAARWSSALRRWSGESLEVSRANKRCGYDFAVPMSRSNTGKSASIIRIGAMQRLVVVIAVGIVAYVVQPDSISWHTRAVVSWDRSVLIYLCLAWWLIASTIRELDPWPRPWHLALTIGIRQLPWLLSGRCGRCWGGSTCRFCCETWRSPNAAEAHLFRFRQSDKPPLRCWRSTGSRPLR